MCVRVLLYVKVSAYALLLINRAANLSGDPYITYPNLGDRCFGKAGKLFVWFGVIFTYIGAVSFLSCSLEQSIEQCMDNIGRILQRVHFENAFPNHSTVQP